MSTNLHDASLAEARPILRTLSPESAMFGLGYAPPILRRTYARITEDGVSSRESAVAEEVPVAFVYNGRSHVVMMATPTDFEDYAYGFSIGEGIVSSAEEITHLEVVKHSLGVELQMTIAADQASQLAGRGRALVGRTGCGLCGVETIQEALRPVHHVSPQPPIEAEALWRAEAALGEHQRWNREAGSMHAAAWASRSGELRVVREDVGRHNALDKVLGALARTGGDPSTGFIVMTSRASYELVQKAAIGGVPLLAAISRPTGLAIRLANEAGITLVGLLRGRTGNVYSHPAGLAP